MCGIIISSKDVPLSSYRYIKNRGPDETNKIQYNGINFIHFLLHVTGKKTVQPLVQNNILCIFNGEIYNYKEIDPTSISDGYSILYSYNKYGDDFVKYLDGEFVIVLFDFNKNLLYISSDIFKTKPLFYSLEDEIIISSYESCCNEIKKQKYKQINANETLIYDLTTKEIIDKKTIYEFDLKQYKTSYNDYINAVEKSILKRYPENSRPLITLSSGLDSGAIATCLNKYNKDAIYITIPNNEDINVLKKRHDILKDKHYFLSISQEDKIKWKKQLLDECEPFIWDWKYNPFLNKLKDGFDVGSMLAKCKILEEIKEFDPNVKVLFSGIGADEIMARNQYYSCGYGNVDVFPDNLSSVFPWPNFFNGSMENYLKGDEYIGGCFSFETRYPFCDKDVVQEFLWLSKELKNEYKKSIYKPPLLYYLEKEKFPMATRKLGFNV